MSGLPGFREALAEVSAMGDALHAPPTPTQNEGGGEDGGAGSPFPTIRT